MDTRLRLLSEPPSALVATVAWDAGDGMVTGVNVWDNPSAVADLFVERVQPLIEAEGEPDYKPVRHGRAIAAYFRSQASSTDSMQPATSDPALRQGSTRT